ncbi:MAG: PIN domain-containing protein [Saprospiraceae bacterium]|nr:PIN domain-containing protein [Saprospiraceae bacterium]
MEKVFVDTNIVLDWIGARAPFYEYARGLFKKAEKKELIVLLSTMSFITIEYILRKEIGKEKALKTLVGVRTITTVCDNGQKEIDLALLSDFKDFEDAFQYYTAKNNHADVLITRNVKDFKNAEIPVMTAEEYLKLSKT